MNLLSGNHLHSPGIDLVKAALDFAYPHRPFWW
jgi:hypothetical protein